ncbi:MAG: NosD domain-containing protein [Halobacteriota archaeon]
MGNIPAAWYEGNIHWYEKFPIDLFYMDIDGNWIDEDNNGTYDDHTGNVTPEIWVGRLDATTLSGDKKSLYSNYFEKNHRYKNLSLYLPNRALVYLDDDFAAWGDYADTEVGILYDNRVLVKDKNITTPEDYKNRLTQGYEWVSLGAHGGWVDPLDIRELDPHVFFYALFQCWAANFRVEDYIGGWYVFTNYGRAAVGSTSSGGMLEGQFYYNALAEEKSFGEAFKEWFIKADEEVTKKESHSFFVEWCSGMVLLGDPTLKPKLSGKIPRTWYVDDEGVEANFIRIQDAVDAASSGDMIIVRDGTYTENVNVTRSLIILSENGSANCIVQATNTSNHVFDATANYVNISGFTVKGATEWLYAGICLNGVDYCDISDNTALNNTVGIYLYGSSNNVLNNNTASFSYNNGISLWGGSNNTLNGNTASNNWCEGIRLGYGNNNILNKNCALNNSKGINLWESHSNVLNNNIAANNEHGIYLQESDNNSIYLNDFINNTDNADSYNSTNIWNFTSKITYTYNGSTCTNFLGNYWDDYEEKYPDAEEIDECGIWDTPYDINSDSDNYPLMELSQNYFAPTENIFDTGSSKNPYPSIFGTHNGTITPNQTITVSKLYTYPCPGTGGHTEYAKIYNDSWSIGTLPWEGYKEDWHNISFNQSFTLVKNKTYNYTIVTGSYPQIIHETPFNATGGTISCDKFIDANGWVYYDWIPAIKLFL